MNPTDPSTENKYGARWRHHPGGLNESPGRKFVPLFFDGFKDQVRAGQTITDFGCGSAQATKDFLAKGLNVTLVDISPYSLDEEIRHLLTLFANQVTFIQACLWQLPEQLKSSYWIYCCHVLEYIPEDTIDAVLEQIAARMRFGGYVSIALQEEHMHPTIKTLKPKNWWEQKLLTHFSILGEDIVQGEECFNCRIAPPKTQIAT